MTQVAVPLRFWRLTRWLGTVVLVMAFQIGVIFWLGDVPRKAPRLWPGVPSLRLAGPGSAELLALTDPTLFALPHRQGFSGMAWLVAEPEIAPGLEWHDSTPRWLLTLAPNQLGTAFRRFVATSSFSPSQLPSQPAPQIILPRPTGGNEFTTASSVELAGGLSGWRLRDQLDLPSWTSGVLLSNSVVQIAVAADGRPLSFTLQPPGCGSASADQRALELARTARFIPPNPPANNRSATPLTDLTWGELIFDWHTLPVPRTNTPNAKP